MKRRPPGTFFRYLLGSFIVEIVVRCFKHRSGDVRCKSAVYVLHCSRKVILLVKMALDDTRCRGIELIVSCFRVIICRHK